MKYGNKPVWVAANGECFDDVSISSENWKKQGGLWFASKLEYRTYIGIESFCKKAKMDCEIHTQFEYHLLSDGLDGETISWNIDFKVYFSHPTNFDEFEYLYIESKGIELPEYKLKYKLMKMLHQEAFNHLVIVKNIKSLDDLLYSKLVNFL